MKCLWVVSGGVEAVPGIRLAKNMGIMWLLVMALQMPLVFSLLIMPS